MITTAQNIIFLITVFRCVVFLFDCMLINYSNNKPMGPRANINIISTLPPQNLFNETFHDSRHVEPEYRKEKRFNPCIVRGLSRN